MGCRDVVLFIGYQEVGNSLKSNPARVKEYTDASCSVKVNDYLQNSWCTHFVYWVLEKAGMTGKVAKTPLGSFSTSRMFDAFPITTSSRPRDLYYKPIVNGKPTHHIGLVSKVFDNEIESLDGNSGDWHDQRTNWSWSKNEQSGGICGGICGGMVCFNRRN